MNNSPASVRFHPALSTPRNCSLNVMIKAFLAAFLLLLLLVVSTANAASYTYNNTVSGPIPDNDAACVSPLIRTINVTDVFNIGDVNVGIVIDHPNKSDLFLTLTSPTGTVSSIIINSGASAEDYNVLLDDQATTGLGPTNHDAFAAYPQFTRQGGLGLNSFNGEAANGIWTLSTCDQTAVNLGTLYRFQLDFIDLPVGGGFSPPSGSAATGTIINDYAAVSSISGTTINVDSTLGFSSGDMGLLIQMKGSTVDRTDTALHGDISSYGAAGRFEFVDISSVAAGSVTLASAPTVPFDATGVVQLIRVAKYTNQTLTGTTSAPAWDGSKGGVVAIDDSATLTLAGDIDVTGLGFRGGALVTEIPYDSCASDQINYTGPAEDGVGRKGEGIVVDTAAHLSRRGHNANGGGGGNITDAGGGGGANYGAGGLGGRELDLCDNDGHFGGLGGQGLDYSPMNRVFMGGGGGSGSEVSQVAVGGPRTGGGIVIIRANQLVSSSGRILSNGLTASNDDSNGADGGGAGGAVAISVNAGLSGFPLIEVQGGDGGSEYNTAYAHGTGGGGGGGAVILNGALCTAVNYSVDEGMAGTSTQGGVFGDPTWGAVDGEPGICLGNFTAIPPAAEMDFGDAPISFGEASASLDSNIYLGSTAPDSETSGSYDYRALGDGTEEDGAPQSQWGVNLFPVLIDTDTSYSTPITVRNSSGDAATLEGWIDFDHSGTFEADEKTTVSVANGVAGTVSLSWSSLPADIERGTTFIRLRLTNDTTGAGEVEDHVISIAKPFPPESPQVSVVVGETVRACQAVVFEDDFDDLSDGLYVGPNRPGSIVVRDWVTTGGGNDTYARTQSQGTGDTAIYLGNGTVRRISPSITSMGGLNFDTDGRLTSTINAIELRSGPDDTTPSTTTTNASSWGPDEVVFSRTFASVVGKTYRLYFTAVPESGSYSNGMMRIDTPVGSAHFLAPASGTGEISYAIEFTATSTSSTIGIANYGHIGESSSGWCNPQHVVDLGGAAWCTQDGTTDGTSTNEVVVDDIYVVEAACDSDYSDAPVNGSTAPDGSSVTDYGEVSHDLVAGIRLGTNIDLDSTSIVSPNADGDGADDDGVLIPTVIQGASITIPVVINQTVANEGYLQAWIDWN